MHSVLLLSLTNFLKPTTDPGCNSKSCISDGNKVFDLKILKSYDSGERLLTQTEESLIQLRRLQMMLMSAFIEVNREMLYHKTDKLLY